MDLTKDLKNEIKQLKDELKNAQEKLENSLNPDEELNKKFKKKN